MANFKIGLTSANKFVYDLYTDDVSIEKICKKKIFYLFKINRWLLTKRITLRFIGKIF